MGGRGVSIGKSAGKAVNEDANPNYLYHSTSHEAFESIQYDGLKKSTRGQLGKGVYFADNVESTKGWTSESKEAVHLRVSKEALRAKYGVEEWGDQSIARKGISAADIEVKASDGSWIKVDNAIQAWETKKKATISKFR